MIDLKTTIRREREPSGSMKKKQAYAGVLSTQPQIVQKNTVLILYPTSVGSFGTVLVSFRNGTSVTMQIGYGQPLNRVPLAGRIVSTVTLLSGSVSYYTTEPNLANAFSTAASSPGGTPGQFFNGSLAGGGTNFKQFPPSGVPANQRAQILRITLSGTAGQDAQVLIYSFGGYILEALFGTASGGAALPSGGAWSAGTASSNTITLGTCLMLDGDYLQITNLSASDALGYNVELYYGFA